ncbi:MAG TPA: hypothetical protein VF103_10255 [Polyangiaceae bacterium]
MRSSAPSRSLIFALTLLTVFLVGWRVQAEPTLVVLVRPAAESAIVNEAITRIRGELVADGFDVLVVDAPPGADPAAILGRSDGETNAAATLGLFLHADARVAELWVVDRLTRKTVMRSIEITSVPEGSEPEVLARRSVELLRASLLEILVDAREKPSESSASRARASHWVERSLPPRTSRWGIEAGAQLLASAGGVGSAVMPVGRVRVALGRQVAARLSLSGLGTRPRVEGAVGTATVSQALGLLELVGEIAPESPVKPSISLGAGTYHIGVDGSASEPYAGTSGDRFVFAADAGVGLTLSMSSSFALSLEGHATLVTPYPVIRFLEVDSAEVNNPLVSASLAGVVRL